MYRIIVTGFMLSFLQGMVLANPFTDQVDNAQVDDEALQQAREQLDNPRTQALEKPLFVPPFHRRSAADEAPATFCHHCHAPAPHNRSARKRAFLNMHSRRIACETCHWRQSGQQLEYRRVKVPGMISEEGLVAPWSAGEPVLTLAGEPWARRLAQDLERADKAKRVEIKARLHQPLEDKGPDCTACHDEQKSILNWRVLGYEEGRIRELQNNPTARFLQRTEPESPDDPVVRIRLRDLLE
jgi:hypothetical protein